MLVARMSSPFVAAAPVLSLLIALVGAAAPAAVLHLALAHAMRARGLPRWRVADTLLVSPLLFLGLFVGFGALARGALPVALGAFVAAGFGARAVGKLY